MKYKQIIERLKTYTNTKEPLATDFIEANEDLFTQEDMENFEDTRREVARIIGEESFVTPQEFSNKDMQYIMNLVRRDEKTVHDFKARLSSDFPHLHKQLKTDLRHIDEVTDKLLARLPHL